MASISSAPNGRRVIQFSLGGGKRQTIRLGKVRMKSAETVKAHVEHLVVARITKSAIEPATAQWLADIEDSLHSKLAAVGLVDPRESNVAAVLEPFLASYLATRTDIKPRTKNNLEQAKGWLVKHFGADRKLPTITAGDADEWRLWLLTKVGDNTARRHCGRAKQFFRAAARKRLIAENPFGDMRGCNVRANRERDYFVTRDEANKVLDACPDDQWRLLFALSRFGGLRCPSEHLGLKWGDIDWANGRMTVRSPKTEHHEGKESRVVPIFPELRPYLEAAFDAAEPGTEHVITIASIRRDKYANIRTRMQQIIRRAGLKPWPKLMHNLRASRETELAQQFPMHVVCEWIGNTQIVAVKHYLRVTDTDFERATAPQPAATAAEVVAEGAAKSGAVEGESAAIALQIPTQQVSANSRNEPQSSNNPKGKHVSLPTAAAGCENLRDSMVPRTGFEQPRGNLVISRGQPRVAQRVAAQTGEITDPALTHIIAVWPRLPENIKAAIRVMVESAAR